MNSQKQKLELLGNAPISKALLAMGIPTMIGMLINALYNLVDAYFVGGLGESQMGAISIVYPLGQVVVGLGLLFGNGAASYISRLLGQGKEEQANKVASTSLYCSLSAGIILILFCVVFLKPILLLLGATKSILPYAMTYAGIYIISCIFNVFNVTMNNIVTSEGAAKTTMLALLTGAILNIALDPIFIYTFDLGVAGAAIATAISQVVSTLVYLYYLFSKKSIFRFHLKDCSIFIYTFDLGVAGAAIATAISQVVSTLVYLYYLFSKKSIFRFHLKDCSFSKEIFSEIFKIGVPTLVFQLLTSLSISLINNASGTYGDAAIAGMGVVTRLVSMGSLTVFGFIKGFQPIAGYSYGAKKYERLRQAIKTSILWSTIFCVVVGFGFFLFPTQIVSQFTTGNAEMIHIGANSLRINGITFMLFGYYTVYSSLFLALGKGKEGFLLGACRQGICFIPVILILPSIWGLNGILYAQPIADVLSFLISLFMALSLHKQLRLSEAQNN